MEQGVTPNNQENLSGRKGYDKWLKRRQNQEVGYELIKFTKKDKQIRNQISKDSVQTIKQQEKEETE